MTITVAVFQPELIKLMTAVLEDAMAMLPQARRTSSVKAEIASHILKCAAKVARFGRTENGCSPSRCGVLARLARYLTRASCEDLKGRSR
jgi:hypothetical protein